MKPLRQLVLVAVALGAMLLSGTLRAAEPELSPTPPGNRREALAILRQWGVLTRKTRVMYVEPFNSREWLVGLKFPDGRKDSYSVDMVDREVGRICHH